MGIQVDNTNRITHQGIFNLGFVGGKMFRAMVEECIE